MNKLLILTDAPTAPLFSPRIRYLVTNLQKLGWSVTVVSECVPQNDFTFPECKHLKFRYYLSGHSVQNRIRWWCDQLFNRKEHDFYRFAINNLTSSDFDVVLCSTFSTFPLPSAARLAEQWGIPLFADLRDIAEQWGDTSFAGKALNTHSKALNHAIFKCYTARAVRQRNKALKAVQAITTVSPWHMQFLAAIHNDVHLIYNGFDEDTFYPEDTTSGHFVISYTGKIYDFGLRNPQLLFQALGELRQDNILPQHLQLHFYSEEPILNALHDMAQHYRVDDILYTHPFLPNKDIPHILHRTSIALLLTNKADRKGPHGIMTTKFFEALGVEKPVLCVRSDEDCLAQVILDTNAGIAATSAEQVKSFILDKYKEWEKNGFTRQPVRNKQLFTRSCQAQQFEQLLTGNMLNDKMINVIIPAYNAGPYIAQCLRSVKQQSYTNWMCIIVNDAATDDTARIAQQFVQSDPRFILLTHDTNKGQSAARNTALDYIQNHPCDFITFVDADDCIEPGYLQTLIRHIGNHDIIQTGYKRFTDNGSIIESKLPRHPYRFVAPWARLYRTQVLKDIRFPEGMIYEDIIFSLQLWAKHPAAIVIPYTGYNYRLNRASTTAHIDKTAQRKLYDAIRRTNAPLWLKIYTLIRLKLHFRK